jgi:aryl-alcohol dehydrogenase-like predicted oxidoreductase
MEPAMQHRQLGRSGLHIAPIVFGGNVFGWTADEATSFALLDAFVASGFNCIDTADAYSRWAPGHVGGESETIIGKWLKRRGKRDDVIVATKFGVDMGDGKKGVSGAYIAQAVEASLARLQADYIDLYQLHFDDEATPVAETMAALAKLVQAGKVRVLGTSNMSPERIRASQAAAGAGPRYETLQPHYNLVERAGYEGNYEALAVEEGLGVIPYWSLAAGYLTGKYRSEADLGKSPRGDGVKKYLTSNGPRVLAALDEISAGLGATPAQVALAWLIARPSITAPIASATTVAQWHDIGKAAELTLSAEAVKKLDAASA